MKLVPLFVMVFLCGCATASHEERASLLKDSVNCEAADQSIAALEAAMPSPGERAMSAVLSLTPVGAVAGVVTRSYRDRALVMTGHTSEELTVRIAEIQAACGVTETPVYQEQ